MIGLLVLHSGNFTNAISTIAPGFGSATGVVSGVVWVVLVALLLFAVRSSRWFDYVASIGEWLAISLFYAVHGVAAATTLALLAAPPYLFATADASTRGAVLFWAGVAIVAYAGLVALGYLARNGFVEPTAANLRERGVLDPDDD